jgi:hypothetical protein
MSKVNETWAVCVGVLCGFSLARVIAESSVKSKVLARGCPRPKGSQKPAITRSVLWSD